MGPWSDGIAVTPPEIQPLPSALWISVISCPDGASYTKPLLAAVVPFTISVAMGRMCVPYSGIFRSIRCSRGEERRRATPGVQQKSVLTAVRFRESHGWVSNSAMRRCSIETAKGGPREGDFLHPTRLLSHSCILVPDLSGPCDLAHHVVGAQHASERAAPPCEWTDPIQHHGWHQTGRRSESVS